MIFKILGLVVNTLTVDEKYSRLNKGNLLQHFQMQLIQKRKTFSQFLFLHFQNLYEIWNIFKKKDTLIADILLKLGTPKNVVR